MIYGCSQPRELWFIDFNHVYPTQMRKRRIEPGEWNTKKYKTHDCFLSLCNIKGRGGAWVYTMIFSKICTDVASS